MSNRQSGIVTSPNYPNNYPNSFDESHTIEVEEGEQIHLEFTDFVLESHPNCRFDYVEGFIFCLDIKCTFSISVVDSQGYQLKKACGEKAGMSFYSFYPLTINFHSDSSVSKGGVNATWAKSTDVTGGSIKSPNFPNLYENLVHQVRSQKLFNYFSNSVSRYGN